MPFAALFGEKFPNLAGAVRRWRRSSGDSAPFPPSLMRPLSRARPGVRCSTGARSWRQGPRCSLECRGRAFSGRLLRRSSYRTGRRVHRPRHCSSRTFLALTPSLNDGIGVAALGTAIGRGGRQENFSSHRRPIADSRDEAANSDAVRYNEFFSLMSGWTSDMQ